MFLELRSWAAIDRPLVLAMLLSIVACDQVTDSVAPADAVVNLESLAVAATVVPADGATLTQVTARVPEMAAGRWRSITLTTTAGSFVQGSATSPTITLTADGMGRVLALLRAPVEPMAALIQATNGGPVRIDSVKFIPAVAERLDLDVDRFVVKAGGNESVSLTATLRRLSGHVSAGTSVRFVARDSVGAEIGLFGAMPPSDTNGVVSTKFTPGPTSYRGRIVITATAPSAATDGVSGSRAVFVANP